MQFIEFFSSIIHIYTLDFTILTLMLQIYMVFKGKYSIIVWIFLVLSGREW